MIGLDTNVLVRYMMQDDAKQAASAARLIESRTAATPGFVSSICVLELAWVLSCAYELDKAQLTAVLEGLPRTQELVVDRAETVWQSLRVFESTNADFAECLIERSAAARGCEKTMTFDRESAKRAGMTLIN